ncbi:16S rRNA (guanine(966)-N(2))-methyltransferase RsmD [Microbacterium telephonicum]|uniref:16S rRNA (Guanine966-N2)-methyltransferase n=1 Tax=Microbacterium telephonicum TaxID=1714841 RepID=A0A498C8Y0_9MICO|nr:16S rRNA (guanine(966)-N(2))-methyltransferase RsmD [Microbacterium telephonicum]RLK49370.1 16S rRNA (guanine966-N2)-methyltransferase [Microbacterium telephonicum]
MTRIISGAAGSLALTVPDAGTRPTSDRVRESLFSALESAGAVDDAAVLDLYAGSGALGLEAVSRGARSADLVEKAPRAASVARRNADAVSRAVAGAAIRVHRAAAEAFVRSDAGRYDLVLIDPPYDVGETEIAELLALLAPRLTPEATVIVERATRSPRPSVPASLVHGRSKKYGDTTMWWLHPAP